VIEKWTQEEIAGYLLNNSVTKEHYDAACEEVRKMGFDPDTVPYTDPDMREKLTTKAEFLADFEAFEQRAKDRKLSPA
jgi:hypothetical protein